MGKLLYRIALYDSRYWSLEFNAANENKYAEWFVANYIWIVIYEEYWKYYGNHWFLITMCSIIRSIF